MDDIIFQEFKGTGNMELVLDRKAAEMRIWPAVNIASSGTRREELLIEAKKLEGIHFFRRALVAQKIEEALKRVQVYALKPDVEARGMQNRVMDGVRLVDYGGFVDLVVEHNAVQSWL